MATTEHPAERAAKPMLTCPRCKEQPGRVLDRDGGGAYFKDCPDCHGTGKIPDLAEGAQAAEKDAAQRAADDAAKAAGSGG